MNLNRQQLSFLITFFSMSLVILLLYNIHLGGMQEEEYVIELSLADEDIEQLLAVKIHGAIITSFFLKYFTISF
ncbi:MAG: hypothetical protein AAFY00_07305, partial [Bacteroidota bacterium]